MDAGEMKRLLKAVDENETRFASLWRAFTAATPTCKSPTVHCVCRSDSVTSNSWSPLTSDPTPRQAGCAASVAGRLVFAGGTAGAFGSPLNLAPERPDHRAIRFR